MGSALEIRIKPPVLRWRRSLFLISRADPIIPPGLDVHLIMDNYSTHKAPSVMNWLIRHRRFRLHFIPTHSSWLNQVEGWFGILTNKQIKRGSHHSVRELEAAIREFLDAHNDAPKPFKWIKTADEILAKVARFCAETVAK